MIYAVWLPVGRHHLFLTVGHLTAPVRPLLRGLREPLRCALERWTDQAAVHSAGCPRTARATHGGPVPRRVTALLKPQAAGGGSRRPGGRLVAATLPACLALTGASAPHTAVGSAHQRGDRPERHCRALTRPRNQVASAGRAHRPA